MSMVSKFVAILGRSDALRNDTDYKESFECAKRLSENGFSIVTGGYGGIMEAASKGAFDSKGKSIGVVCSLFRNRKPNAYISQIVSAKSLFERQKHILEKADAFVAFEPKAGTLSEVALIFALRKSGEKIFSPLCLVGEKWRKIIDFFKKERIIPENLLKYTFLFERGVDASQTLIDFFEKEVISDKEK